MTDELNDLQREWFEDTFGPMDNKTLDEARKAMAKARLEYLESQEDLTPAEREELEARRRDQE